MGRRKLEMELIPEKRARMLTFKKRKEGLMKKIEELTTLCDVKACMVIYEENCALPEIYPKDNLHETCGIINDYKKTKRDLCKGKSFGLSCYFKQREREVEKELVSLRKKKMNAKYTTWNSALEAERDPLVLRRLADRLAVKSQIVKSRIQFLKKQDQFPPFFDMAASASASGSGSGSGSGCTSNIMQMQQYGGLFEAEIPMMGYNEIVNYEPQLPYMAFTNDGSEYYCPPPLKIDDAGTDYLWPLPQSYVSFPTWNQSPHQSEADTLQLQCPYMITDDEGSDYLLPFN